MIQALLVGLIVFIGKADYFVGTANLGRPLVLGALVGIALGDVKTGVMLGFELELVFMGMQAIGASIPPDMIVGSVLGTAFAISTGSGVETAITIAMTIIAKEPPIYFPIGFPPSKPINMYIMAGIFIADASASTSPMTIDSLNLFPFSLPENRKNFARISNISFALLYGIFY